MSAQPDLDELTIHDNLEQRRYEAHIGQKLVGVIAYRAEPGRVTLIHTEVDPAFEGKGVGSRLVAGALEDLRGRGLSVVPVCPFVRGYLRRHPDQGNLVATG